jgi:hypothetical protein
MKGWRPIADHLASVGPDAWGSDAEPDALPEGTQTRCRGTCALAVVCGTGVAAPSLRRVANRGTASFNARRLRGAFVMKVARRPDQSKSDTGVR